MIQPLHSARIYWALDWHDVTTPVVIDGFVHLPTCLFVLGEQGAQLVGSDAMREVDQRRVESFLARLFNEKGAPDSLVIATHPTWDLPAWKAFGDEFRVKIKVLPSASGDPRGLLKLAAELKGEMAERMMEPARRLAAKRTATEIAGGLFASATQVAGDEKREQMLRKAVECDPACVEALLALGELGFRRGELAKALDHYGRVVATEERRQKDKTPDWWKDVTTRPYLKALFGQMFVLWHMGKLDPAAELGERILSLNPTDNQGVRFLMPMLYLLAGHLESAWQFYSRYQTAYPGDYTEPAFLFGWGLTAALMDDDEASALRYRQGMLKNINIAPLLLDLPGPRADLWYPNDRAEPNYAYEFFDSFAILWERDPMALRSLREVYDSMSGVIGELVEMRVKMGDFQDQRYDPEHDKVWKGMIAAEKAFVKGEAGFERL